MSSPSPKLHGYEFHEQLGKGGFGEVYRAYQPALDRFVAVKIVRPEHTNNDIFIRRFQAEARIIARLEHFHIVPLLDYWADATGVYLVMRHLSGGTLADWVRPDNPPAKLLLPFTQIAQALDYAHQLYIIHRDLKPANILLDEQGNAYLSDFGIALLTGSNKLTTTGVIIGSVDYMSPEQAQTLPLDGRSDIYALGVMLYELLTGDKPFSADSPVGILFKKLSDPLPSLLAIRPELPAALDDVIQQATAFKPEDRYASASEFIRAYQAVLQSPSTPVRLPAEISSDPPTLQAMPETPTSLVGARHVLPSAPVKLTSASTDKNRDRMLAKVEQFWVKGVLENSLHGAALLELGMTYRPEAVDRAWEMVLQQSDQPDRPLPRGTHILNVFDELNGELLILGAPGSGKTTTLLELARDLIQRARTDATHPIPVVFNLASWAEARRSLYDWLIEELNTKYQVPKKIGATWLAEDAILPLLDELDEVRADVRDACVSAINTFRSEHGLLPIVVCSRIVDYEALSNRLKLTGAIVLQPLTLAQVTGFLTAAGAELAAVRAVLDDDEKLQELVTSPLMLSIVTLAYHGMNISEIEAFDTLEERRKHLFDHYVERMLARRGREERYTPEQTKHYLAWLANQMQKYAQSVFYIEGLQPPLLQDKDLLVYHFILIQVVIMIVILYDYSLWVIPNTENQSFILHILAIEIIGVSYFILLSMYLVGNIGFIGKYNRKKLIGNRIFLRETLVLRFSRNRFVAAFLVVSLLSYVIATPGDLLSALIIGLGVGLVVAMLSSGAVVLKIRPNQGVFQSAKNALFFLSVIPIFFFFSYTYILLFNVTDFTDHLITSVIYMFIWLVTPFMLYYGGLTVLQHTLLRSILWRSGDIPLNYAHFLDFAAARILLRKVGGGYVFMHRLLLDYFANLETSADQQSTTINDEAPDVSRLALTEGGDTSQSTLRPDLLQGKHA